MDLDANLPEIGTFDKEWPLKEKAFVFSYDQTPFKRAPFQPEKCPSDETHTDYYVSPRKFIRYIVGQGHDYVCASNFNI